MEDKKATEILIKMLNKYPFETNEKEAISEAIGILSWSSLAESRLKRIASKRKNAKLDFSE